MKTNRSLLTALVLTMGAVCVVPAQADNPGAVVTPNFSHEIPNIPGKSLKAVVVTYPPGGSSPSHRHASSAFIYVHVLSGAIESQVAGEPAKIYKVGETFYEVPGAHHVLSRNASKTEPASFLAVFVVDTKESVLTAADK